MEYAPVIIPTLNRYNHFVKCLTSLESCIGAEKTDVYVALDYPPSSKYIEGWKKTDSFLKDKETCNSFRKLHVIRRDKNYGIKGETKNSSVLYKYVSELYDRVILSEDDNVFSPNFLLYMNDCLEKYQDDPDVIAVTGYSFPIDWKTSDGASVQKQNFNASAWGEGWWTQKRKEVLQRINSGDMYDNAPYVLKHNLHKKGLFVSFYEYVCASIIPIDYLRKIRSGRLYVTDYCARQYLFVYGKYVISPLVSKVRNIGIDGSGVYCQNNQAIDCDGRDSWHTDFTHQAIDENTTFNIVENDEGFLEENRKRLDEYEWRPKSQHIIANLVAFGIRILGLKFMRLLTSIVFKVWHRRVN